MIRISQLAALTVAPVVLASGLSFAHPIAAPGTEGFAVVVSNTNDVIATYLGTTASYTDLLFLDSPVNGLGQIFNNQASPVNSTVNLGSFAAGTELVFRLEVTNTGDNFYSGLASRNSDGLAHARAQSNWAPNTTLVSFEDLWGDPEGASGFNDLSFSFTNVQSTNPVPEPETYAMLLAGLGLLGFVARRRKQQDAA
jgi:hypothetical protein